MRLASSLIAAAIVAGFSSPSFAQSGSGTSQQAATSPQASQSVVSPSTDDARNWVVSGFLGTNFGSSRNTTVLSLQALENFDTGTTSANFGGQVAYLGRGVIGGEFLADFSPNTSTFSNVLFEHKPNVNSYMINAIAVAPFGYARTVDPYVSGGIGWVTMSATIFTVDPTLVGTGNAIGTESVSGSRFGWDLGGGIMAWSERNWGFRGDVRYYRTGSDSTTVFDPRNIGNGDPFTQVELSGISFWKVNAGVSFRW